MTPKIRLLTLLAALLTSSHALNPQLALAQNIIRDAETETLLLDITKPILRVAQLPNPNAKIILSQSPELNAFALASGNVLLTTGVINAADSPDMLAGVYAHELGHFLGRHHQLREKARKASGVASVFGFLLGAAAIVAGAEEAGVAAAIIPQTVSANLQAKYSRRQEEQADQTAIRLMTNANVSPRGLLTLFSTFQEQQRGLLAGVSPYLLSHPQSSTRVRTLKHALSLSQAPPASPTISERLLRVQAKLAAFLAPEPEDFIRRTPSQNPSFSQQYALAIALHLTGKSQLALKTLQPLINAEPKNPYLFELYAQITLEAGYPLDAVPIYQHARDLSPPSSLSRQILTLELSRALIASNDPPLLQKAVNRLTTLTSANIPKDIRAEAWNRIARAHGKLLNTPLAELATAQQMVVVGNPVIAARHAQRAKELINDPSSFHYQQALDVIQWTQNFKPPPAEEYIDDGGRPFALN